VIRRLAASVIPMLPQRAQYELLTRFSKPRRYRNMIQATKKTHATSISEIGVNRGTRACQMIKASKVFSPGSQIRYYGFDLFEELTDELFKSEFSKRPPSEADIHAVLEGAGACIELYKGFSQKTLPVFVEEWKKDPKPVDIVFLDGGHAEDTIAEDWKNVSQVMGPQTVVIFDDYYKVDPSAHIGRVGCQYLIDSLDRSIYDVRVLEPQDVFQKEWGELGINLAQVTLKR